jgi:hypothetical protein
MFHGAVGLTGPIDLMPLKCSIFFMETSVDYRNPLRGLKCSTAFRPPRWKGPGVGQEASLGRPRVIATSRYRCLNFVQQRVQREGVHSLL